MGKMEYHFRQTVTNWRIGDDAKGFSHFRQGLEEMEKLLSYFSAEQELTQVLKKIVKEIRKPDFVGLMDVLELECLPWIEKWKIRGILS